MNIKRLLVIVGLCALVVLAWYGWNKQASFEHQTSSQPLIPKLTSKVNDIEQLEISKADTTVTLVKQKDQWVMSAQDDFPIDVTKVRALLLAIADSNRIEKKTGDSTRFDKLGLDEASRVTVTAYVDTKKNDTLFSVALGDFNGTLGTYVLVANESNIWLVSGQLQADDTAVHWLQTELFNIQPQEIVSIDVHHPGERSAKLRNTGGAPVLQLEEISEDEMADVTKINTLATALRKLEFEQVRAESDKELVAAVVSDIVTRDGLAIQSHVFEEKGGKEYWIKFSVSIDEQAIQPAEDNTADTHEVIFLRTQEQVTALTKRLHNRVFKISDTVGTALISQHSDLVTPKEPSDSGEGNK